MFLYTPRIFLVTFLMSPLSKSVEKTPHSFVQDLDFKFTGCTLLCTPCTVSQSQCPTLTTLFNGGVANKPHLCKKSFFLRLLNVFHFCVEIYEHVFYNIYIALIDILLLIFLMSKASYL